MKSFRYHFWLTPAVLTAFLVCMSSMAVAQDVTIKYNTPGYDRASAGESPVSVSIMHATPTTVADPIEGDWSEGFADITTLPGDGWAMQNNSDPEGTTGWFQGNDGVFPAHEGPPDSYIGANFNATTGSNTISNWLLTPEVVLENGTNITFWTRTGEGSSWPDRLQVRLSTEGASVDVGTGPEDVGDFTTLLLDINEFYDVGGYPEEWTSYNLSASGLAEPTTGRFAFRYYVHDGGPSGNNSNFIGIDTFELAQPKVNTEGEAVAGAFALSSVYPNPSTGVSHVNLQVDAAQFVSIEVFNLLGQRVATVFDGNVTAGTNVVPVDASGLTAGLYIVRVIGEEFTQSRRFVVSH